ncbi:MAG: BREX-3 system P-loop-containing protein BrxF [Acidobacteriaceae bacterium]|jgi:hypothetical protein|nr:BREX-3 system P-loop-containing protein BrxF [Acidobacteriaceae bacterium]
MHTASAFDNICSLFSGIDQLYSRLILVVGPSRSGKSALLRALAENRAAPIVNSGTAVSRRLLDLSDKQRSLQLLKLLEETVCYAPPSLVLLDNTEVLFDPALRQDPLRVLQTISRSRTVVAAWCGKVVDGYLTYAIPGHPEYRQYSAADLLVVPVGQKA